MCPIKAGAIVAQKMEMSNLDPSGDTWVWVRPATGRDCLQRGQLLRNVSVDASGLLHNTVNPILLQNKEIWLTAGNEDGEIGRIVVERPDGSTHTFFKKKKSEYTEQEFVSELMELPPVVARTWNTLVRQVNEDWFYPF